MYLLCLESPSPSNHGFSIPTGFKGVTEQEELFGTVAAKIPNGPPPPQFIGCHPFLASVWQGLGRHVAAIQFIRSGTGSGTHMRSRPPFQTSVPDLA